MELLIVYDTTGRIIYQGQGDVYEPVGIPKMRVTVPNGKRIVSINTVIEPHEPVFADIMGIDPDTATLEQLKAYQITKSKENLETYLEANPITSKCHGGAEKQYTITKEKQALLTQEMAIVQMAIQAGIEYQPSWNAAGEPCTYDWTLEEIKQLAFEAVTVVKPLISHQQTIEAQINAAQTKKEVLAISIEF
ncbi:hypothetical protein R2R35_14255 [Anaerocolumna sp. AGMB13020]|uniref:hypothetical protein n=1 Tax=Anaerocolumna sp. AGMB13020 TaxID=3081750 RepID=UPI002954FD16|nr:hypothetical protein [Anaerocolumna sp. AGMB13020]WOO34960.1 hypothetical protein R2R35_14255 [Anaerocolumna sp. AGMB13020]